MEKNSTTEGEYIYDGDGKRIQATENSVTTTYICSGWDVLYEETSTGTACYIYGPTGILAKRTTINQESDTYFYHTDHLGSTRLVTDESKNIVSTITYHPFGEIDIKEGAEDFLFTGKEMDFTGFYYYGARYYDPDIGRFITRDTWTYLPNDVRFFGNALAQWMSDPQVFNRYSYCRNNPLKYIDPAGHGWFWRAVTLIGVAVAAAALFVAIFLLVFATGGLAIPLIWLGVTIVAGLGAAYGFALEWGDIFADEDGNILEVYQKKDGEIIGGYKKGTKDGVASYWVWDAENKEWVFLPEDLWDPPPLPEDGEEAPPITIQNYPPKERSKNQESDLSGNPPSTTSSSTGGGTIPPIGPAARDNSIL